MLELYAEVRGSGPALVLVPGGGGDAGLYEDVVPLLAERYTVITYDRRGNSRSPLASPDDPVDVDTQARDVIALLDRLGIRQAAVFGSSGGAIIALALVAHHADRLTCAVVHEPPLMGVLEPDSPERAIIEGIYRCAQENGAMRGFAELGAMTMSNPPWLFRSTAGRAFVAAGSRAMLAVGRVLQVFSGRTADTMTRVLGNVEILFARELPEFCDYAVDMEGLGDCPVPWALATGADSAGRPYDRPARVLANRVGVDCVSFPGGHTSYQEDPSAFTRRLTFLVKELERCRE